MAEAYGLPAFPYWVFVDADGTVAGRLTGELTTDQLDEVVANLARLTALVSPRSGRRRR